MLPPLVLAKNCLACDKPMKGRSDKKFCDDYCRNAYHNYMKSADSRYQRAVNSLLRKNRRILQSKLGDRETVKITRELLLQQGFSFSYHTHSYRARTGNTYYYCYEYGYLALENDQFLLVRQKEPVTAP